MRTDTHHELLTWPAKCACGLRFSISSSHEQLLEDYQVHRDVIDEAARFESQHLDEAVGRDGMNTVRLWTPGDAT